MQRNKQEEEAGEMDSGKREVSETPHTSFKVTLRFITARALFGSCWLNWLQTSLLPVGPTMFVLL